MANVDTSVDVMKANSEAFLYNLKVMEYQIRKVIKPFLLDDDGSIFYLETVDVDVTTVMLAQTLKSLEKELILKANYNAMFISYGNNFTTMSLKQKEDWANNFPDLLVCKLNKDEQLDEQSLILKSLVDIIKDKYKKIIFIMQDSKHLERSLMKIGMANIIKSKFVELWRSGNEPITKSNTICNVENNQANLDKENVVNNKAALKRPLEEDTNGDVKKKRVPFRTFSQTLLHGEEVDNNANSVNLLQRLAARLGLNDVHAVDKYGNTQLHLAAREGKMQIVELLLAHGIQKDIRNHKYKTALHWAVIKSQYLIVKMLLEYGFDVNANQINQWTPLHYASRHNHVHLIEILLKFGAKIEREDGDGQTALHLAAQWGHSGVVNLLLKHGANIDAQDNDGDTPLHDATRHEQQETVTMLLQNGANINIKNRNNQTALDEARIWKKNVIQIFEKHVIMPK